MTDDTGEPRCECGYICKGDTPAARALDGQHHARDAHGIEVSPEQVLTRGGTGWD